MPRASFHDYHSRCIYHITMTKAPGAPAFGRLVGTLPDISIERTPLGKAIAAGIATMPEFSPLIKVLQYMIMPDHIHLLIFVTSRLERPLGRYMGMFKVKVGQMYRAKYELEGPVFEDDFYDCILYRSRSLDTLYRYLRDNPRRLAVRREHPEYFRRVNGLEVAGRRVQAYGNLFLLRSPFKEQVVVHRADTDAVKAQNRERWLHTAANGGVLVSPFISPAEKAVRAEAVEAGGKIILITHEPMGERYKPAARDFALCEEGRLLIVSTAGCGDLSRAACMAMNALAEAICK